MARNVDNIGGLAQAALNVGSPINRRTLRFTDGGGVTWAVVDDPGSNEVDISATASGAGAPAGAMMDFAGTAAPSGWLECDGSAVSRVTFATLFAAIGTTWGPGDGSTTFNLPNMNRRTSVGRGGSGTGVLGNAVGNVGGTETHALSIAELAAHTHSDSGHSHSGTTSTQGVGGLDVMSNGNSWLMMTGNMAGGPFAIPLSVNNASANISNTGSGTGHNNVQPSAIVMKIIKT